MPITTAVFDALSRYSLSTIRASIAHYATHPMCVNMAQPTKFVLLSRSWGLIALLQFTKQNIRLHEIPTEIAKARLGGDLQKTVRFSALKQSYHGMYNMLKKHPHLVDPLLEFVHFFHLFVVGLDHATLSAESEAYACASNILLDALGGCGVGVAVNHYLMIKSHLAELDANATGILEDLLFLRSDYPLQVIPAISALFDVYYTGVQQIQQQQAPPQYFQPPYPPPPLPAWTCLNCAKRYKYESCYFKHVELCQKSPQQQDSTKLCRPWE